jgi:methyltransferase (TIGR00027 family)
MKAGVASRTALGVARRRAAHQVLDIPVIFEDPLAETIISGMENVPSRESRGSRLLRAFVAARSRYAEDELALFFKRGIRQYVVLGAGLDTFAYRNPYAPALNVFEVDYPDTQFWKRERLEAAGIAIPDSLRFVSVNFEKQDLAEELKNAPGFNPALPAFFSLLGVTPYLTREALLATLQVIAAMPPGSGVVFDYAVPAVCLNPLERLALSILSAKVAQIGEAFRLFLEPHELSAIMRQLGFTSIEDLGQHEINARYFHNRRDGLRIGGAVGRLLRATILAAGPAA